MKKYMKLLAMLMALCMLSACAGPAGESAVEEVTAESSAGAAPEELSRVDEAWADYAINSPEMAEETARTELAGLQELGIVSGEIDFEGIAPDFVDFFDDTWEDGPHWSVRWYGGRSYLNDWEGGNKYSLNVNIDPNTGVIDYFSIEACADEDDEVSREEKLLLDYDPASGEDKETEVTWLYYENYDDIVAGDMSIDEFCTQLAEYWGCDSYTLCATEDYGYNIQAPDGSRLLTDISNIDMNYYMTVEFEQNGEAKPCYIQMGQFPARVFLNVGNSHTKG